MARNNKSIDDEANDDEKTLLLKEYYKYLIPETIYYFYHTHSYTECYFNNISNKFLSEISEIKTIKHESNINNWHKNIQLYMINTIEAFLEKLIGITICNDSYKYTFMTNDYSIICANIICNARAVSIPLKRKDKIIQITHNQLTKNNDELLNKYVNNIDEWSKDDIVQNILDFYLSEKYELYNECGE